MIDFKLIGLNLNRRTTNKNGQSGKDCGELWQNFEKDKIAERIPNKTSEAIYAVYFDYDSDENGTFSYFVGCKVDIDTKTPEDLSELLIPKQTYKTVEAKGKMPGCIAEAWQDIWKAGLNRNFGFDFEKYDERSLNWENAEVDIYLSVKE